MASLFTMSDGDLKARIDEARERIDEVLVTGQPYLLKPETYQRLFGMATVYQNELNRRLLEKILKTQTDDE